jgi:hypothetical protein
LHSPLARFPPASTLLHPAETLDRKLTENELKGYTAALVELESLQIIRAFSRAATESKFFPAPAALCNYRTCAATSDLMANEAKELFRITFESPPRVSRKEYAFRLSAIGM